jgi:uncharacterized protein (DUF1810 family)
LFELVPEQGLLSNDHQERQDFTHPHRSAMSSDLRRFHDAQGHGPGCAYEGALAELRNGRKQGHWIWFVLPQLRGLGCSPTSQHYGINDLAEAQAYLADPFLAERLERVIRTVGDQLQQPGQTLALLMGSDLDAVKTISSLTLFEAAGMDIAAVLLDRLGQRCPSTQALCASPKA